MTINCLKKTKEFKELKTEIFIPFQEDKKEEEKENKKEGRKLGELGEVGEQMLGELGEQMGEWVGEWVEVETDGINYYSNFPSEKKMGLIEFVKLISPFLIISISLFFPSSAWAASTQATKATKDLSKDIPKDFPSFPSFPSLNPSFPSLNRSLTSSLESLEQELKKPYKNPFGYTGNGFKVIYPNSLKNKIIKDNYAFKNKDVVKVGRKLVDNVIDNVRDNVIEFPLSIIPSLPILFNQTNNVNIPKILNNNFNSNFNSNLSSNLNKKDLYLIIPKIPNYLISSNGNYNGNYYYNESLINQILKNLMSFFGTYSFFNLMALMADRLMADRSSPKFSKKFDKKLNKNLDPHTYHNIIEVIEIKEIGEIREIKEIRESKKIKEFKGLSKEFKGFKGFERLKGLKGLERLRAGGLNPIGNVVDAAKFLFQLRNSLNRKDNNNNNNNRDNQTTRNINNSDNSNVGFFDDLFSRKQLPARQPSVLDRIGTVGTPTTVLFFTWWLLKIISENQHPNKKIPVPDLPFSVPIPKIREKTFSEKMREFASALVDFGTPTPYIIILVGILIWYFTYRKSSLSESFRFMDTMFTTLSKNWNQALNDYRTNLQQTQAEAKKANEEILNSSRIKVQELENKINILENKVQTKQSKIEEQTQTINNLKFNNDYAGRSLADCQVDVSECRVENQQIINGVAYVENELKNQYGNVDCQKVQNSNYQITHRINDYIQDNSKNIHRELHKEVNIAIQQYPDKIQPRFLDGVKEFLGIKTNPNNPHKLVEAKHDKKHDKQTKSNNKIQKGSSYLGDLFSSLFESNTETNIETNIEVNTESIQNIKTIEPIGTIGTTGTIGPKAGTIEPIEPIQGQIIIGEIRENLGTTGLEELRELGEFADLRQIGEQMGGQTINLGQQKTLIKDYPTIHPSNSRDSRDSRDLLNSPIYSINEINTQDVFIRTNFILDTDILDTDNTNNINTNNIANNIANNNPNTNSNININNNINNNIVENIENTPGDN